MTNRRAFLAQVAAAAAAGLSPVVAAQQGTVASEKRGFKVRFAIASDGHFGQTGTDFDRFHREMVDWLNDESRAKGLDFVVFNGDVVHDDPRLLPKLKEAYDRLEVSYFVNRGNHDKASPELWRQTWGYPENHDFEWDDYVFLLASTSNEKGEYLPADVKWLRDRLDFYKGRRGIFPFLHIAQLKFTQHAISAPEVTNLFEQTSNVVAVFHGHDHDLDNVIRWNNRRYFFDGHMGGSWGTNYRGYRIIEVSQEGRIQTYQCNPQAFYVNAATLARS
jgi:3',5'-cyclic-AMP phosphodiesterase